VTLVSTASLFSSLVSLLSEFSFQLLIAQISNQVVENNHGGIIFSDRPDTSYNRRIPAGNRANCVFSSILVDGTLRLINGWVV
jgi:hypothetical protein